MTVTRHWPLVLAVLLALVTPPLARATTTPPISGNVLGIVICQPPQCPGQAFAGSFVGTIDTSAVTTAFGVSIRYDHLPTLSDPPMPIAAGGWIIHPAVSAPSYGGSVTNGTITAIGIHGQPTNTYMVSATFVLTPGGVSAGTLTFSGILNANAIPPSMIGSLSQ
ncbi:MAG: hypothetical protein HY294_00900 [Candidatus Rokubacteria bacterium]|nr:hypothetical protein [Candidatus Rokubacteria bacterium]MBI3824538.1 hypothetical protein [Candidatus Rokubacteria bacterium]